MRVTIFKSIKDTSVPFYRDIGPILNRIKEGKSKGLIETIRKEEDKEKRNLIKQQLPAVCFSGEFSERKDKSILQHSGFICLDFDGFKSTKDLLKTRNTLTSDEYSYSVFTSPSGNGLKVIVKIPQDPENHVKYFMSLQDYYNIDEFDPTSKNISRVCYESYDPDIYINKESKVYDSLEIVSHEQLEYTSAQPTFVLTEHDTIIKRLKKWWESKYGMIEGQRNNNIFILASALNDFGIDKTSAVYVLSEYIGNGFSSSEMQTTINSAYANVANFNTRFFEDTSAREEVSRKLRVGVPKKEIRSQLKTQGFEGETIDLVIKNEEEKIGSSDFWVKSERGVVSLIPFKFKEYLEKVGFYKYKPEGSENYIFISITSNVIDITTEDRIKDHVLDFLINLEDLSIYNHFAERTKYFKDDFLSLLSYKQIHFMSDTTTHSYLYYKNVALEVTKNNLNLIEYDNLPGFVWKDQIIDREFEICDDIDCDYSKFISNVSESNLNRILAVRSTIGFLLHGFKNAGYCPAVIINDEVISDDPEGGTGKGLFVQGVSQLKKNVTIDGKAFLFERSFAYQLVSVDTQILTFDDVKKNFEFERLFSLITEGITLEKKNKDAIKIAFKDSPKVVITTNYAIKGKGNSYERRKWELEFYAHYSKEFTPLDEFGKLFFNDWDSDEWCSFDNYMVKCLQLFLSKGLISAPFKNLKDRKFEAETCREFVTFIAENKELFPYDTKINSNSVRIEFVLQNPDYSKLSHSKWNKWIKIACKHMTKKEAEQGRDNTGIYFIFKEPITQAALWN